LDAAQLSLTASFIILQSPLKKAKKRRVKKMNIDGICNFIPSSLYPRCAVVMEARGVKLKIENLTGFWIYSNF
jgi:hypothetical protein